jgi:hypothetical protein
LAALQSPRCHGGEQGGGGATSVSAWRDAAALRVAMGRGREEQRAVRRRQQLLRGKEETFVRRWRGEEDVGAAERCLRRRVGGSERKRA